MWDALERAELRLVCAAEGLDTANGDHELNFAIKAALAREQWKQYKRRSEATKKHAVEQLGIHIGPAPFGYTRALHEPLRRDPKLGKVVRDAFESARDRGVVARRDSVPRPRRLREARPGTAPGR